VKVAASTCANAYCHNNDKNDSYNRGEMNGKWKRNEPKNAHSKHIATNTHYFFGQGGWLDGVSSGKGRKKQERDANVPIFHVSSRQLSLEVTFENIKHLLIC
jgi:predicted CxxxxCH...CXXCH cytochrome family protein